MLLIISSQSFRFVSSAILCTLAKAATPHSYFKGHLQIEKIEVSLVPVTCQCIGNVFVCLFVCSIVICAFKR